MAVLHRNPMPLSGALFVTNPRRRRNSLSTRRNALRRRRNSAVQQMSLFEYTKAGGTKGGSISTKKASSKRKTSTRKTSSSRGKPMSKYRKMQKEGAKLGLKVIGVKQSTLARNIAKAKGKKSSPKRKSSAKRSSAKSSVSKMTVAQLKKALTRAGKKPKSGQNKAYYAAKYKRDIASKKSSPKRKSSAKRSSGVRISTTTPISKLFQLGLSFGISEKKMDNMNRADLMAAVRAGRGKTQSKYGRMSRKQLLAAAKSKKFVGYSKLTNAQLRARLQRGTLGKRKKSDWGVFQAKMKDVGLDRAEMKALFKKKKTPKQLNELKSRIKSKIRSIARVGRKTRRKAKDLIKKDMPTLFNPFKKITNRKNPLFGINVLAMPLQAIATIQEKIADVPVIKNIAFAVTPLALGAGVYAVHRVVEPMLIPHIDKLLQNKYVPAPIKKLVHYPYSVTGVSVGLALALLAKYGLVSKQAATIVASSAVSVGMALDLSLKPFAEAAGDVATEKTLEVVEVSEQPLSGVHMGALQQNPHGYGDGGQYMIGRNTTALGNYGAVKMGAMHMGSMHDYNDASMADAQACTCVMMPEEVAAAKAGQAAYRRKFGVSPNNKRKIQSLRSRHAGRAGHRFGWLVKMIGWNNFQKIASLPEKQRATVINQLQKQAIASIPQIIAAQQAQNASVESASVPVDGTINGVQGFEGVGYGAMMFAGQGY